MHIEADLLQHRLVDHIATVEEKRRTLHRLVQCRKVRCTEFVPLRQDRDRMCIARRFGRRRVDLYAVVDEFAVLLAEFTMLVPKGVLQVTADLDGLYTGVVDCQMRPLHQQIASDSNGWRFACIVRVFLEGESP